MQTTAQQFQRVKTLIFTHSHRMSPVLLDKALSLWSRLLVTPGSTLQKSKSADSNSLVIDTTEQDKKWKEQRRREDRNTRGKESADTPDDKPEEKPKEKVVDIGRNKERKPVSLNKYKVRMPNGRTMLYTINENGSLSHKWTDDYIPTYKEVPELHHGHIQEIHGHIQDNAKEHAVNQAIADSAKATEENQKPDNERHEEKQQIQKSQPWGSQHALYRGRTDLSRLSARQQAAMKAGLDPATPGIEGMSFDAMKRLASDQVKASVADLANKNQKMSQR